MGVQLWPTDNSPEWDDTDRRSGANLSVPPPEVERQLHDPDVLILPIGGRERILTSAEIATSTAKDQCNMQDTPMAPESICRRESASRLHSPVFCSVTAGRGVKEACPRPRWSSRIAWRRGARRYDNLAQWWNRRA